MHLTNTTASPRRCVASLSAFASGLFAGMLFLAPAHGSESASSVTLVKEGKALGVVVLPENADSAITELAQYFVGILERSSGATLPIVSEVAANELPPETARLYIGPTRKAEMAGLRIKDLPEESYRILTQDNAVVVLGRDVKREAGIQRSQARSQPTRWALNRLAEEQLGVRWLWPGDLGTYVPKKPNFSVPETDISYQPKLTSRQYVPAWYLNAARRERPSGKLTPEETETILKNEQTTIQAGVDWLENHQCGERDTFKFPSHAFTEWWARYGKSNPDFFAQPPSGEKLSIHHPASLKLRISNPEVIEQIAKEYVAAGAPAHWAVTPNDGAGFDTSAETLEWDLPKGQPIMDIWRGRANLTARYITFWNRIYERLREINPDVTLNALAYSAYKEPPFAERPLTAKIKLGIVPDYKDEAYATWRGWADLIGGGGIRLRPNWWHRQHSAPHLPLDEIATFIKFTEKNKLDSVRMDAVTGFWGTKGPSYYLVTRLISNPELTKDQVLEEYVSAFGKAAPKVREYLDYWQRITSDMDRYLSPDPTAQRYLSNIKAGNVANHMTTFSMNYRLLHHLYPDSIVRPAQDLLDEAADLAGGEADEARQRVEFLQDGLKEFVLTRDTIAVGLELAGDANAPKKKVKTFKNLSKQLEKLRAELTDRHVVWGGAVTRREYNLDVPTVVPYISKLPRPKDEQDVAVAVDDL